MAEFVQIEKTVLEDIFNRVSYLRKVLCILYERVRNKEPDDWVTLKELCGMLHISESKARSLKKGGHISYTKCGKNHLFLAGDVAEMMLRIDKKDVSG